jgi:hypothetical protein
MRDDRADARDRHQPQGRPLLPDLSQDLLVQLVMYGRPLLGKMQSA